MGPKTVSAKLYAANEWAQCADYQNPNNWDFNPCPDYVGCAEVGPAYNYEGYQHRYGEFICYVGHRILSSHGFAKEMGG